MTYGVSQPPAKVQRELVLIADDEAIVRMVLCEMLEGLGHAVMTAADASETLDLFEQNREAIKLVILDYKMPGLSGGEVFDHLRRTDPEVPVLISSGHSDTIDLDDLRSRGLKGFLPKPYSLDRIRRELETILG